MHNGLCEILFMLLSSLQNPYLHQNTSESEEHSYGRIPVVYVFAVLRSLLENVQINSINLQIKPKQPLLVKKLNQFYNNPMNQTCKMWSIFVDACTLFISQFFKTDAENFIKLGKEMRIKPLSLDRAISGSVGIGFDPLAEFFFSKVNFIKGAKSVLIGQNDGRKIHDYINTAYLNRTTSLLMSIQTSLAKAIYTANLRFFLDVLAIKILQFNTFSTSGGLEPPCVNPIDSDMDEYLISLMENDQKLPIFVYFARVLEQKFSMMNVSGLGQKRIKTIEQIAVESGIRCVETFCQRYMLNQNKYSPESYMLIPENYE